MSNKSPGAQTKAYEDSEQPVNDSWITTKVKADLLVTEETKGLDINVSTTNGVVTLSGKLDNASQIGKAVEVTRAIKGVKSVDATTLTTKPRG
jgi:hyperosmotically inducible protein